MQTVLGNGNLYACWMLSLSSRKSSTATVPLQVFPAAGGRTVERMLYASLLRQTVARYPPETPRSPCRRQTSPTHLTDHRKKRQRKVPQHLCTLRIRFLDAYVCKGYKSRHTC